MTYEIPNYLLAIRCKILQIGTNPNTTTLNWAGYNIHWEKDILCINACIRKCNHFTLIKNHMSFLET